MESEPGRVTFRDSRDLFESALAATRECDRARRAIERMEARERMSYGSVPAGSSGHASRDPTDRTDARIAYEEKIRARIDESLALTDYATEVLYGIGMRGGLDRLMTPAHADAMWWHYLADEPWGSVAERVGYSASWCKHASVDAFARINEVGVDLVRLGRSA